MPTDSLTDISFFIPQKPDNRHDIPDHYTPAKIARHREEAINTLKKLELKDHYYNKVSAIAWEDIYLKLHSISLSGLPAQPQLFVIPREATKPLSELYSYRTFLMGIADRHLGGFLWPEYRLCIVISNGNKTEDAMKIHHELNHAMAQLKIVDFVDNRKLGNKKHVDIVGLYTESSNRNKRGQVLEEGIVTYESLEFIVSSFKRNFPQEYKKYLKGTSRQTDELSSSQEKQLILRKLETTMTERYLLAHTIMKTLIDKVRKYHPLGSVFEHDLLAARLIPQRRRSLIQSIDKVFGKGTSRQLFQAQFDNPAQLKGIVSQLQKLP